MKIALIEPVGGHGGMNYYDAGLSQGLISANCHVHWYTCNATKENAFAGLVIHKFFREIYSKKLPSFLRAVLFFSGLLVSLVHARVIGCKLVHLHFFHYTKLEWLTIKCVRLFFFKYVVTVHDVQSFVGGDNTAYADYIFSNASALIVHNQYSLDSLELKAKSHSVNLPEIYVIPHGNYLPFISKKFKSSCRDVLGVPKEKKVLLFFGQIKKVKGLDLLLAALVHLKKEDFLLVIAGKVWKDDWTTYQDYIDQNGLADKVKLNIRYIDDNEVDTFFSAADFVVLPYREIFQSGVLLMGMSYGVVPIVSNIRGMTEIVEHDRTGFVFESESVSDLVKVLRYSLAQENTSTIEDNINQKIQDKYDWGVIGKSTFSVYEKIAN